ncbi:hypothetical protein NQ315_006036 [Exocentrus adspersus]|uniref:Uncharacterized protein n=1 Tax=Exocentrus adspersus TaxID=1586481 RepID=A0AAV8VG32_9CUCU|nr:hypothetical protein NQ315_006036 [Exocentrus adspersus]
MVFIFFYWAPIVKNTCTIEQQSHNKIIQYSRTMSGLSSRFHQYSFRYLIKIFMNLKLYLSTEDCLCIQANKGKTLAIMQRKQVNLKLQLGVTNH